MPASKHGLAEMRPTMAAASAPAAPRGDFGRQAGLYALGLMVALCPLILVFNDRYWGNILAYTYLFAGLAAAWNIIGGFGGQFSLAHGVFFGIGAYAASIGYVQFGVSPWLSLLASAPVAALLATLVSWPNFRLRGPFFAIATMAVNEVAFAFANYFERVTGGPRGVFVPFRAGLENIMFREQWKYALVNFGFMAFVVALTFVLMRRRLGYYLLAVREDEDAARASGVAVLAVKLRGMALSAALTALGGGLFAMFIRQVDPPTLFSLQDVGVKFALLALIGGIGTVWGPVIGAFLVIPLENQLRAVMTDVFPGADRVVLGVLLILAARFMKVGLVGTFKDVRARVARR